MDFKCIAVVFICISHSWEAVIPPKDPLSALSQQSSMMQYHPNMTTMWMMDDIGRLRQVYLTPRPPRSSHIDAINPADHVFFFLYTREYNSAYQITRDDHERFTNSTFDPSRNTKVVIHGFWNGYQSDAVQVVREAYLNCYDVNVIAVDWSYMAAGPWYVDAVSYTQPVGQVIAKMLDFIVSCGANMTNIHLIGHSLGAHVAGFASNAATSGNIRRITGMDPALPLFWFSPPDKRLDSTDADIVDCIHTCGDFLGFYKPLCTHDFYPNGGKASQPGCHWDFTGACSHSRSYRYFGASLMSKNFTAQRCASMDEVKGGNCKSGMGVMGDPAPKYAPGLYYLVTNGNYPY